jgi:hypothetical protein
VRSRGNVLLFLAKQEDYGRRLRGRAQPFVRRVFEEEVPGAQAQGLPPQCDARQLPRIHEVEPWQVTGTKATELAKVARRDGQRFNCATWLHKARELPKEEFKREVSKHLTGKGTESWEILHFKADKIHLLVVEQALDTAALMPRSDKSRGYCLEMICANFLAGASTERDRSAEAFAGLKLEISRSS